MKFMNIFSSCAVLSVAAVSCGPTSTPVTPASMGDRRQIFLGKIVGIYQKLGNIKSEKEAIEIILKDLILDAFDKVRGDGKWELNIFSQTDGFPGDLSKEALAQAAESKDLDIEAIFQSMKEQPDRYVTAIDAALKSDASDAKDKPATHKAVVDAVVKEFKQGGGNVLYWVAGISGGFIVLAGAGSLIYIFFVRPKNHSLDV